ncbi:hypothetical protein EV360DRAFT_83960 [Lentinula raphanica]|nr:hypothetical protein EV360DRAFT_83960 [Lentinula raphanica]
MTRLTASRMLAVLFLAATISSGSLAAPTTSSPMSFNPSSTEAQAQNPDLQHRGVEPANLVPRRVDDDHTFQDLKHNQGEKDSEQEPSNSSLHVNLIQRRGDARQQLQEADAAVNALKLIKEKVFTMSSENSRRLYIKQMEGSLREVKQSAVTIKAENSGFPAIESVAENAIKRCDELLTQGGLAV